MTEPYARARLDLESPESGIDFLWEPLGLQGHGLSLLRFQPGEGQPFWHSHERQEEVYVVLEGQATIRVGDEELILERGECLRVAASAVRAVGNRGARPLRVLCTGALPLAEKRSGASRGALLRDGKRHKELGVPDWGRRAPQGA